MAAAKLLGFDLCPRLRGLRERKLFVPRGWPVPESLEGVTVRRVSIKAIEHGWDDLVRLAASIRAGKVSGVRLISVQKVTVHARPQSEHWRGVRSAPLRKCLSGNEFLLVLQSAVERLFVGAISAGGACFRRGL